MKQRKAAILAACWVAGVTAWGDDVTNVTPVGHTIKHLAPNGRLLVTVCFDNVANGGTHTLLSVFESNQLLRASNYILADRVLMYKPEVPGYQAYAQYVDGRFYPCNTLKQWNESYPTNPVIPPGSSFWLVRGSGAMTTNDICIAGQVVTAAMHQVRIAAGYQLVGYPFSASIPIQSINTAGMTAAANYGRADRMAVWQNNGYQFYALYSGDRRWYPCNNAWQWETSAPATGVLDVAEGFWFIARTNFLWTETNPYPGSLGGAGDASPARSQRP